MVRKRQQAHCRSDNTRLEAIFHSLEVTHKVFQMFRVPQLVTIEHHDVARWRDARSLCSRALRVELLPGEIRRTPTSNDMADTQRTFPGRPAGQSAKRDAQNSFFECWVVRGPAMGT